MNIRRANCISTHLFHNLATFSASYLKNMTETVQLHSLIRIWFPEQQTLHTHTYTLYNVTTHTVGTALYHNINLTTWADFGRTDITGHVEPNVKCENFLHNKMLITLQQWGNWYRILIHNFIWSVLYTMEQGFKLYFMQKLPSIGTWKATLTKVNYKLHIR